MSVNFFDVFKTVVSAGVSMHQSTEERKKALALSKNNPYDEKLLDQINENELKMVEIHDFLVSVFTSLGETLQENFDEINKRLGVIEGLNSQAIQNYTNMIRPVDYELAYKKEV